MLQRNFRMKKKLQYHMTMTFFVFICHLSCWIWTVHILACRSQTPVVVLWQLFFKYEDIFGSPFYFMFVIKNYIVRRSIIVVNFVKSFKIFDVIPLRLAIQAKHRRGGHSGQNVGVRHLKFDIGPNGSEKKVDLIYLFINLLGLI